MLEDLATYNMGVRMTADRSQPDLLPQRPEMSPQISWIVGSSSWEEKLGMAMTNTGRPLRYGALAHASKSFSFRTECMIIGPRR